MSFSTHSPCRILGSQNSHTRTHCDTTVDRVLPNIALTWFDTVLSVQAFQDLRSKLEKWGHGLITLFQNKNRFRFSLFYSSMFQRFSKANSEFLFPATHEKTPALLGGQISCLRRPLPEEKNPTLNPLDCFKPIPAFTARLLGWISSDEVPRNYKKLINLNSVRNCTPAKRQEFQGTRNLIDLHIDEATLLGT